MREFFRTCLKNLYVYCGNRQIEKMDDEEIKTLLDALERMSKLYSYIPEERQKEIIQNCLLTDKEYQNINVRTVSKWLELNGKQYFKQEAHQEQEQSPDYKPLEGEARDKAINEYLQAIARAEQNFTSAITNNSGSGSRLRESMGEVGKGNAWKAFVIDGVEIYAPSEERARQMLNGQ